MYNSALLCTKKYNHKKWNIVQLEKMKGREKQIGKLF